MKPKYLLLIALIISITSLKAQPVARISSISSAYHLNGIVNSICEYKSNLYICGNNLQDYRPFPLQSDQLSMVAKWKSGKWNSIGMQFFQRANVMTVYKNRLIVGGKYTNGVPSILQWNDTSILQLGTGVHGDVEGLCVYNNELYVTGDITNAGGNPITNRIAKWNGNTWSEVNMPAGLAMGAMGIYNNTLCVATSVGTSILLNCWNGTTWVSTPGIAGGIESICEFNSQLYISGNFTGGIARLVSGAWTIVDQGLDMGSGVGSKMIVHNNRLIVSGIFSTAGLINAYRLAAWTGTQWDTVVNANSFFATQSSSIHALYISNNQLHFGGDFFYYDGVGSNDNTITGLAKVVYVNAAPTIKTSNIHFRNRTDTSITIAWQNGNGSKRIVSIAYNNPSYKTLPQPGRSYVAARFGAGDSLGSKNYIVYNGSDTIVNVKGLIQGGIYKVNVYEYNGSAGLENYALGTTNSFISLSKEPTLASSNIVFTNPTSNSRTITYNRGNGFSKIVIARIDSPVNRFPVDGLDYYSNANYGTIQNSDQFAESNHLGQNNFVVLNKSIFQFGSDTTFELTGLLPNRKYYICVIDYNSAQTGSSNYLTSTTLTGVTSAMYTEPTASPVNLTFSNITSNSIRLNWTNGNGTDRIVIASKGTPSFDQPVDATSYSFNTNIKLAPWIGNSQIVYKGNANNCTITNLGSDSIYYFYVYEFNGFGDAENYLTNTFIAAGRSTLAKEPTQQSKNIAFNFVKIPVFPNGLDDYLKIAVNPGNGKQRVVIMRQDLAVNKTPSDTIHYAIGMNLGDNNIVVYNGIDSVFYLNQLIPESTYHFAVFEYNGSIPTANNYLSTNPLRGSRININTEPTQQPANLVITNVSGNSMSLAWDNGDGERRIVIAKTSAVNRFPEDGLQYHASDTMGKGTNLGLNNFVVYSGSGNSVDLTGLVPNTTYHFALLEYNGENLTNNYLIDSLPLKGSKSTLIAEPTTAASNLTLSPITNGITTVNWTKGNGTNRMVVVRQSSPINQLPVDGTQGYTANSSFGLGTDLGGGNFICYSGNGNSFNLQGLDPANLYYITVIEYNGTGAGANYNTNTFPIADNLPNEPSLISSNLNFNSVGSSSMKLQFTKGNGSFRLVIAKALSAVDRLPVDGSIYVANSNFGSGADLGNGNFVVYNGSSDSLSLTGLNSNTTYHFAVIEFNKDIVGPANYLTSSILTGSKQTLNGTGINNTENHLNVSLYPNPSKNGEVNIKFNSVIEKEIRIKIINSLGQEMMSYQVLPEPHSSNQTYKLNTLSSGLYLIELSDGIKRSVLKLMVE